MIDLDFPGLTCGFLQWFYLFAVRSVVRAVLKLIAVVKKSWFPAG